MGRGYPSRTELARHFLAGSRAGALLIATPLGGQSSSTTADFQRPVEGVNV